MFLCSDCGKKLTNVSTYYKKDVIQLKKGNVIVGKRPVCKECRR